MTATATRKRYGIKPEFRANSIGISRDSSETDDYWTESRIAKSGMYQYFVYRLGRTLIERDQLRRVLDVGCGPGTKSQELIAPCGVDLTLIDQPSIQEVARKRVPNARFVAIDLETCDVDLDQNFDLILCADVIEHLADPDPCIRFIKRHLSPEGYAVISTPERDVMRGVHAIRSTNPDHVREWNKPELIRYLHDQDLSVVDHRLLPPSRLPNAEYLISRLVANRLPRRRWSGSQAAVCRHHEETS